MLLNKKFGYLQYGRASLESVMKSVMGYESPLVAPPEEFGENFYEGNELNFNV